MRETDCDKMRDDLKAYLDRELPPWRRWSMARHLVSCAACRAEAKEMAQITEELTRDEAEALDPTLRNRLVDELSSVTPPPMRRRTANRYTEWALIAAFIGCVVITSMRFLGGTAANKLNGVSANVSSSDGGPYQGENETYAPVVTASLPPSAGTTARQSNNATIKAQAAKPADSTAVAGDDESLGRRVHKTATITVQVPDPEASGEKIEDMVKSAGGFVTSSNLTTDPEGVKTSQLTVKVPLPQFETSLTQIAKLGSVTAKNVTGEDITQKVSDADQRQIVLEQDMSQAQDLLKKKGTKAGWELQEDVRDLRVQLAQARARLKILKSLAELSEIEITLTQPAKPAPPVQTGFLSDVGNSGHNALQSSLGAVSTLIAFIFWILAYAPIWIPAILIGRWSWRAYQKRSVAAS